MVQGTSIAELADEAREREKAGYDGLWTFETAHDPFVQLMPVAEHSERLAIGTSIAVAFARSPMTMAYTANDLQTHSRGRLLLGLGSQVKPHIERRFAMPWSNPALRMREYISALRAIWPARAMAEMVFKGERARALFAPGRAVLRVGDGAVSPRRIGAFQGREPIAELHALGLEARRVDVGDVDRDHFHNALLRDEARGGDSAGDVHAGVGARRVPCRSSERFLSLRGAKRPQCQAGGMRDLHHSA
jgi:hypothetical protein